MYRTEESLEIIDNLLCVTADICSLYNGDTYGFAMYSFLKK
jgi:hypothetical protein